MLGTKLGPYWLTCWGFLCPVLLPLLLTYVLVTQVIIGNITTIITPPSSSSLHSRKTCGKYTIMKMRQCSVMLKCKCVKFFLIKFNFVSSFSLPAQSNLHIVPHSREQKKCLETFQSECFLHRKVSTKSIYGQPLDRRS